MIRLLVLLDLSASTLLGTSAAIDLSGNWSFALNPMRNGEQLGWHSFPENWNTVDTSAAASDGWDQVNGWDTVVVPHCWTVDPRYGEYTGHAWYRRSFQIPANIGNSSFLLKIESIGERGQIWINGIPVAQTSVAGISTTHDITAALKPGEPNLITIRADNTWSYDTIPGASDNSPKPKDQVYPWPNYGGILGNITIQQVPQYHLQSQQIITTLNTNGSSTLTISAQLSAAPPNATLTLKITAPDGTSTGTAGKFPLAKTVVFSPPRLLRVLPPLEILIIRILTHQNPPLAERLPNPETQIRSRIGRIKSILVNRPHWI